MRCSSKSKLITMLLRNKPDELYQKWNSKWGAPFGKEYSPKPTIFSTLSLIRCINKQNLVVKLQLFANLFGMVAFERNNSNRVFEYPWAFFATSLDSAMNVLEIGGGFSGLQFVLAKHVSEVTNIDPMINGHTRLRNQTLFNKLNSAFQTNVKLLQPKIQKVELKSNYFDRVFCISVLEHLNDQDRSAIMKYTHQMLRPGGFFILSIDLFLDLVPFSNKRKNQYGTNASVYELFKQQNFRLASGKPAELYGFPNFNHKVINGLTPQPQLWVGRV